MTASATLDRAYVNNGGDIAIHLQPGNNSSSVSWNGQIARRCSEQPF